MLKASVVNNAKLNVYSNLVCSKATNHYVACFCGLVP